MLTSDTRRTPKRACSGASARASPIVVQFGLATMPPLPGSSNARCSGFTSGTTSGTPGEKRWLFALVTTSLPARAQADSSSPATLAESAENTSGALGSCAASRTGRRAASAGSSLGSIQRATSA